MNKSITEMITSIKDMKTYSFYIGRYANSRLSSCSFSYKCWYYDGYFSSWLYGQQKSTEQIPVGLYRSMPCLVCSEENPKYDDVSLLNVDLNSFIPCLPLFNNEQLSILYSLLDDDRQVYEHAIRQQYGDYKRILIQNLKEKLARQYYLV
jgi:hypothetical protein